MVGIPTNVLMPALIAFFAVALGTASVALIFEWLQEQRRKRRMVGELRTLADEPLDPSGRGPLLRSAILDSPWLRPIAARIDHPLLARGLLIIDGRQQFERCRRHVNWVGFLTQFLGRQAIRLQAAALHGGAQLLDQQGAPAGLDVRHTGQAAGLDPLLD